MNADAKTSTVSEEQQVTLHNTQGQDRLLEPPRFWESHRWSVIIALAVIAIIVGVVWAVARWSGAQRSVDLSQLTIATVKRGSFVRDVAADGQVVAAVSPTLYAPWSGTVVLKAHAGDLAEKGQLLAVVESNDLGAELSQEQATLENLRIDWQRARLTAERTLAQLHDAYRQAEIDWKTAQREVERSRKAYELGSYSELQVLKAEATLEKAELAYDQAKANYESQPQQNRFDIDSNKALLDRQQYLVTDLLGRVDALQIRSPVGGMVGQVEVADRASVAKDAPLLTVVDLSALQVEIKVPQSLARDLTTGMTADLEGDGRRWSGSISAISPQVIEGQVAARLRFSDQKLQGLRQNQRLSVRIFIERHDDVLMVDRGPFLEQEGGGFVYLVRGDVAERHPVRLGDASVQKVEVVEGLKEGDRIVVSGTDVFYGAQRVILAD